MVAGSPRGFRAAHFQVACARQTHDLRTGAWHFEITRRLRFVLEVDHGIRLLLENAHAAFNARDIEAVLAALHEDVV